MKKAILISVVLALLPLFLGIQQKPARKPAEAPSHPAGVPLATMLNINQIAAWYNATGEQERDPYNGTAGLYYPRGTTTAIYAAGLLWGGLFQDSIAPVMRVNGQSYNNGTKPGAILGIRTGIAEDPSSPDVRIWRIRPDYATADLKRDAAEVLNHGNLTTISDAQIQQTREQYAKDWQEWPWQKGAPFYDTGYVGPNGIEILGKGNGVLDWGEDANHNGVLDPGEDINRNGKLDAERPGIASADQVIWYVCNDIGVAQPWSSPESGIEEQTTIWGYNRIDPLGHSVFKRFRIVYKGTKNTSASARIEKMYLMQWSDPDLGESGDDFAGCDTTLNMAYVYNGVPIDPNYAQFNLVPPACGYDLMQGPLVKGVPGEDRNRNGVDDASDWAIYDFERVGPGFINLSMTSAEPGDYWTNDPPFNYTSAISWYQMMRGLPPYPIGPPDPPMVTDPVSNLRTPYWMSGDPVSKSGWIDGIIYQPGDRRVPMSSGPFDLALGDSQEVVFTFIAGLGTDNINSITVMRFNSKFVQTAFDSLFKMPGPPANPVLRATGINSTIILEWGIDSASVAATESTVTYGDYRFQGYKLYQFPAAITDQSRAKLLGQWDLPDGIKLIEQQVLDPVTGKTYLQPVQYGTDNGIIHQLNLFSDSLTGGHFIPGKSYYFALTAYNYTSQPNPVRTYESSPVIMTVVPEMTAPGTRYGYNPGDTVQVKDIVGANDARVAPVVYNPARQSGSTYHLEFDTAANGSFLWTFSESAGKTILNAIADLSGDIPYEIPGAGFTLRVAAPLTGVKGVVNEEGVNVFGPDSPDPLYDVLSTTGTFSGFAAPSPRTGRMYEIRFDGVGSYIVRNGTSLSTSGVYRAPFSVWDLGRSPADTARQVIAWIKWDKVLSSRDRWSIDTSRVTIGGVKYEVFEAISITSLTYPLGPNDSAAVYAVRNTVNSVGTNPNEQRCAVYFALFRDKTGPGTIPPVGTRVRFSKYLSLKHGDTKLVAPIPNTINDPSLAKADVSAIKAFPNPFYGSQQPGNPHVMTFSHLPTHAIVRIFNLAGIYVRRLEKTDASTQFLQWDMTNESGARVANGIYIVQVDMPELGTSKTLKVVVMLEATE